MNLLWSLIFSASLLIIAALFLYEWFQKSRSIAGKHVVVTGGSSGIGKSVAMSAAKRGANVTIIARDKQRLEDAVLEINKVIVDKAQRVQYLSIDITQDYSATEKALINLEEQSGAVYMFVNCAGAAVCGRLEDTSSTDIQKQIALNLVGTIYPTKAIVARMKSRAEGIVVVTGSIASLIGIYGFTVYSSTKFALRGFAEALNMETKPYGVSVTLALPPDTDTPGFANEEKSKPLETRLICESGGLVPPDTVGEKIMADALKGKFFSYVGFESGIICMLCAGMSPPACFKSLALEALFMGPLRLIGACLLMRFNAIVKKCKHDRNKNKKLE